MHGTAAKTAGRTAARPAGDRPVVFAGSADRPGNSRPITERQQHGTPRALCAFLVYRVKSSTAPIASPRDLRLALPSRAEMVRVETNQGTLTGHSFRS